MKITLQFYLLIVNLNFSDFIPPLLTPLEWQNEFLQILPLQYIVKRLKGKTPQVM